MEILDSSSAIVSARKRADSCALVLAELARSAGVPHLPDRVELAWRGEAGPEGRREPLDQLIQAAAGTELRLTPARLTLRDAIWAARPELPLVAWSPVRGNWVILRHAGWFQVQIWTEDTGMNGRRITTGELADWLGAAGSAAWVEVAVVQAKFPADSLSSDPTRVKSGRGPRLAAHSGHEAHQAPVSLAQRFLALIYDERRNVYPFLIFSVLGGILYLAAPLAVDAVVSNLAFGRADQIYGQALVALAIALFACLALGALFQACQYYLGEIIQRRIFVRLAMDQAHRLPRVDTAAMEGINPPELLNRFLDVVTLQKSTAFLLLDGLNVLLSTLIGMGFLAFLHPYFMGLTLVLMALLVATVFGLGRRSVTTAVAESERKYAVVNWFEEIARHPLLFKSGAGAALAQQRADQLTRDYLWARQAHFRIWLRQLTGLLALQVLGTAALLALGGWLVLRQELTLGQLVASELVMAGIVASLGKFGKQLEAWYDALAAVNKVGHLVDLPMESATGDEASAPVRAARLEGRELSAGFKNGRRLFAGLSFVVAPGERVAVVGAQGSGATSLLNLVYRLREPAEGQLSLDGLDLKDWSLDALREQVVVLRAGEIVEGTILENVRLGRFEVGLPEVRAALARVGLLSVVQELPEGLQTRLLSEGHPLSSPQRLRLLAARLWVLRPRLILLDELLDGLDPETLDQVAIMLLGPEAPWTALVATRDPDVIRKCDRQIAIPLAKPAAGVEISHHV